MLSTDAIRNIVGIIGNVISFGLFLSPVSTFYQICRKKEVGDFSPIPYLATVLNCMLWVFYGIPVVHPHSILVVTINGIGLVLEAIYLTIFVTFAPSSSRCKVFKILMGEIVFMAAVVVGVILGAHTHDKRSLIVGVMCVIFGTCMYASPLAAMRNVVKTKSVKYMPLPLSLASFLNGVCWTVYALLKFDIFITIPNGLGALLGALQLLLYGFYYFRSPDGEHESEVQMQHTSTTNGGVGDHLPQLTRGQLSAISIQ